MDWEFQLFPQFVALLECLLNDLLQQYLEHHLLQELSLLLFIDFLVP